MKRTLAILLLVTLLVAILPASALAATKEKVYRVNTRSGNLMVHSEPNDKKSTRIGYLSKGSAVTVLKKSGKWYRIKAMKGLEGWVYSSYLAAGAFATVNTKETGLNIHSKPNLNKNTVIGSAPKGAQVTVAYIQGTLANVKYKKLNGWSARSYLKWIA